MTASDGIQPTAAAAGERPTVLIAGGGIAGLELLLALRVLAGNRVAITLLSADAELAPRAMTVAEPFERGGAERYAWSQIAEQQGAHLVIDALVAVDTAARIAFTHSGRRIPYDIVAITTGARRVAPFPDALTFGTSTRAAAATRLHAIVADLPADGSAAVVFALPSPSIWPLPLYELALLTAAELRERGSRAPVRIVTSEQQPLELFGAAPAEALAPTFEALAIDLVTNAQPREVVADALRLADGQLLAADHVITFADITTRPLPGLPTDRLGFIPVDVHRRVESKPGVYAAGEVTSFPLRQGGLATQQADAVAEAIAPACGADVTPEPFRPVLRGRLLTSGAPLYLQSRPSGQSIASATALWSPPEKIAGRFLAPYLAAARPARLGASPLVERVPACVATSDERDAVTLALALAEAEARCANTSRARQALEAAQAVDRDPPGARMAAASGGGGGA